MESTSSPDEEVKKLVQDMLEWLEEDEQEENNCCERTTSNEDALVSDDDKHQRHNPVSVLYGL